MRRRFAAIVLAVFGLGGCMRTAIEYGAGGDRNRLPEHYEWRHHFVVGLVNGDPEPVDVREICPSGSATVVTYLGVLNALLLFVPVMNLIWETTSVVVYCGPPSRSADAD